MLNTYDLNQQQTAAGMAPPPRPASAVESAAMSAVEAQYKLTDALHELQRRLEPALASSYPDRASGENKAQLEPASQLVGQFKHSETQTNIHLSIVGDILSRLTL